MVVKPPEWAPLTCSLLADIAHAAGIPAGVLNVVQGIGEDAGAALVAHDDVDRISFTGSPETGRLIGVAGARNLVPVSVELGGKSPFIVCADVDLEAAAQTVAMQYINAGPGVPRRDPHPRRNLGRGGVSGEGAASGGGDGRRRSRANPGRASVR